MSELVEADIEKLAALFLANGWTELRVRTGDVEILLSTDRSTPSLGDVPASAPDTPRLAPTAPPPPTPAPIADQAATPDAALSPVKAPNLGTFYRSPKPGSPPFVNIGERVEVDTEICLLEVMKLFTSVKAGVAGTLRQVCAADAELVEAGRILFTIEAD